MGMCAGEKVPDRSSVDAMHSCWSCKGPVAARALFCSICGVVQPPGQIDHFARLGLQRTFDINRADLDRQYFGFQRRLHPDRFVMRSPKERALSQQQATAVNEAYEILRDPLRRADYLLHLMGRNSGEERGRPADPDLLMEMMERREELAEASGADAVNALAARAEADVTACQNDIGKAFADSDPDRAESLTARLKYLVRLLEETRLRKRRIDAEKNTGR